MTGEGRGIILEEEVNDFRLVYENEREGDETIYGSANSKERGRPRLRRTGKEIECSLNSINLSFVNTNGNTNRIFWDW